MSVRKLYYALPPKLRLLVRRLIYIPIDLFRREKYENGLRVPPRALIFTGAGDFKETGLRFLEYFKKHGLQDHHKVLDVGSGMGRMALPMTDYLTGQYQGLDIMKQGVEWCRENITKPYPNFQFKYLDVANDLYRSKGKRASDITFPIDKDTIDFTILISVFTHMQPEEVGHYLKEINRCLKIGGKCFATFFIYHEMETLETNNFQKFYAQDNNHALMNEVVKSANVAYSYDFLLSMIEEKGFQMEHYSKGKWKDEAAQEDFQDFVVLVKI